MARARVNLTGGGVTGLSTSTFMYGGSDYDAFVNALIVFYEVVRQRTPSSVSFDIGTGGELLESSNGDIVDVWQSTYSVQSMVGAASAFHAQGVGARVVWETAGRTANRRVRGSTFLVPLYSAAFGDNGAIEASVKAALQAGATGMVAALAGDLVIWSRPADGRLGAAHPVTSARVPSEISWLRSRRT